MYFCLLVILASPIGYSNYCFRSAGSTTIISKGGPGKRTASNVAIAHSLQFLGQTHGGTATVSLGCKTPNPPLLTRISTIFVSLKGLFFIKISGEKPEYPFARISLSVSVNICSIAFNDASLISAVASGLNLTCRSTQFSSGLDLSMPDSGGLLVQLKIKMPHTAKINSLQKNPYDFNERENVNFITDDLKVI
jgi:hypothetical protein